MATRKRSKVPMKKAASTRGRDSKPSAPVPATRRQIRNPVPVDEAREKALVEDAVALSVRTQNGPDELAEVLGEGFVENVTGANDAINEELAVKVAKDAEVNEGGLPPKTAVEMNKSRSS